MKPIFIIVMPPYVSIENITEIKRNFSKESVSEDYHVLFTVGKVETPEFKLLNGTEKNYASIEELKELVLSFI